VVTDKDVAPAFAEMLRSHGVEVLLA
jgi:hypothetical protein